MSSRIIIGILCSIILLLSCKENHSGTNKEEDSQIKESLVSLDPNLPDTVREENIIKLINQENYSAAIVQADLLLKKDPNQPAWLYLKANALEYKGDTTQAILHYEQAIRSADLFTEAAVDLANLYAEKGDARSLSICESMLKEPSTLNRRSDILLIRAAYYRRSGKHEQALEQLDQIIREDYTYTEAYIDKGLLLYDQKLYQ